MKKIKFKYNQKIIFRSIYILILIINIIGLFYFYGFIEKYVYGAIVIDKTYLEAEAKQSSQNINLSKFNEVINKLEQKSQKRNLNNLKDIFQ